MENNDFKENLFKDIYEDFFGKGNSEKRYNDLKSTVNVTDEIPEIELEHNKEIQNGNISSEKEDMETQKDIEELLNDLLEKIDNLSN